MGVLTKICTIRSNPKYEIKQRVKEKIKDWVL